MDAAYSIGRVAHVEAQSSENGYVATRVELFDDYSVPGATTVFVYGQVDRTEPAFGKAQIGTLQLDITALSLSGSVASASEVAIPDIQPELAGVILSYDQLIADENLAAALATSSLLSISGSSLQSISGSSLN